MRWYKKPTPLWVFVTVLISIFVIWFVIEVSGFNLGGQISWLTGGGIQPGQLGAFGKGLHSTWFKYLPNAGWRWYDGYWAFVGYMFIEDGMVLTHTNKPYLPLGTGESTGYYNFSITLGNNSDRIIFAFRMDGAYLSGTYQFKVDLLKGEEVVISKIYNMTIESNSVLPKNFEFSWNIDKNIDWDSCRVVYYKGWTRSGISINAFFFYLATFYPYLIVITSAIIIVAVSFFVLKLVLKKFGKTRVQECTASKF